MSLCLGAGCSESSDPRPGAEADSHRLGVQIVSTSVDLSAFDVCWRAGGEEVRIELDGEMLDSSATRFLDVPTGAGLDVALVEPGQSCQGSEAQRVSVPTLDEIPEEGAILYLSGDDGAPLQGEVVVAESSETDAWDSLRSSTCDGRAPYAKRETISSAAGGCTTRVRLYECKLFHHLASDGGGTTSYYGVTYDSGWIDCSDSCMGGA